MLKKSNIDPIMKQLSETLKKKFGDRIKDMILYGSRARGNHQPDSDYDVIVLVDRETKELEDKIRNLAWDIGWEHNVFITVFVHEKSRFEKLKYEPLFMNIRKEGVSIVPRSRRIVTKDKVLSKTGSYYDKSATLPSSSKVLTKSGSYMSRDRGLQEQLKIMMNKAEESLEIAKELHGQKHYAVAVSRTYYAVFHSLQTILLTLGLSFSKHSEVKGAFNKEFIHKGIFPRDFYSKIERLYDDRQIGDYGYEKKIEREVSNQNIIDAEIIIKSIERYLVKEGFLDI